jgi:hypothetical protein
MKFVKQLAGAAAIGVTLLIDFGLSAPPAQAGYIVTLTQVADPSQPLGTDVVATGSGPIDLMGLSFSSTAAGGAEIAPFQGRIFTGPTFVGDFDVYTGVTGPKNFGSGGFTSANSGSGDPVDIVGLTTALSVPLGYVSGSALSDTSTYDNKTFSNLGATPGTYEWTWGTGPNQNFTLQVGAVPAPSIGQGLPVVLAIGGVLFGAKLLERNRKARHAHSST